MNLGLGLYRHMLTSENLAFARQVGATHIIAHLVDYFRGGSRPESDDQPTGGDRGWGPAGDPDKIWSLDELVSLRRQVEEAGLKLEAIENFDPAHWYDVLLDGPRRSEQMENLKTIVRRIGRAGIPILGYNFSLAGVCGRVTGPFARGGALSVGMNGPFDAPLPQGMVWNMVYDAGASPECVPSITQDELWSRVRRFLDELIPVAEEAGVRLAAHPDDPPTMTMRGQPRLVYQPRLYQRLIDLNASPSNALEFCIGTLGEMTEGNIYETVDTYSRQGRLAYVHLRNVTGKVPFYRETFLDDGDIDMIRILRILRRNDYAGVLIPDHTPSMACPGAWHAGMAYALGYIRAVLQAIDSDEAGGGR